MYGLCKVTGELLCQYYHKKFGVDVRGIRLPGVISWKALPGGGTTDYAVDIFYEALKKGKYVSFLGPDSYLPMMFMDDAVNSIIQIMMAPPEKIKNRMSYNITGMSFSPKELAAEIKKKLPDFEIEYKPDERQ